MTDITEFPVPDGKVYLSPMIDCFDGLAVSWSISASPNADLVNAMLGDLFVSWLALAGESILASGVGCAARTLEHRAMNTKVMRNVFDRHVRPTRELDRFLFATLD
ncbi:hypothetical protein BA900_01605 [Spiribacter roseus]|nr:hypothetical protein BA900_01605 [Spiribacter roseus]